MLLKKGSTGNDVVLLQRALHLFADGIFGTLTCEAVKQFQKENGLQVDGIVGDKTWNLLFSSNEKIALERSTRKITEIIVHCSATPEGANYTVADITRWHKARHLATTTSYTLTAVCTRGATSTLRVLTARTTTGTASESATSAAVPTTAS